MKWNFRQLIRSTIRMIISPEGVPIAFIKKERRICMKNVSNLEAYVRFSMFKLLARPFFIPRILQWIFSSITKIFWSYNWVSNYMLYFFLRIHIFCLEVGNSAYEERRGTKKSQNTQKLNERQKSAFSTMVAWGFLISMKVLTGDSASQVFQCFWN